MNRPTFKSQQRWPKPCPESKAAAEARALQRRTSLGRQYPQPRPELAVSITVVNHETGRTHLVELGRPCSPRARCDQYELRVDGTVYGSRSNKTALKGVLTALLPPVLSARRM